MPLDSNSFASELARLMQDHGDSPGRLCKALKRRGDTFDQSTIRMWKQGRMEPQKVGSFELLRRIEARYGLAEGHFRQLLAASSRTIARKHLAGFTSGERKRLASHLPDNFDARTAEEKRQILAWIRNVVLFGVTDYRRYQVRISKDRFGLRVRGSEPRDPANKALAPDLLAREVLDLVKFKTAELTPAGYQRIGVWGDETAHQMTKRLEMMFGALAAPPGGSVNGLGLRREQLSMALLMIPGIWDWLLDWRKTRRGFFTTWEVDMMRFAAAITRQATGWLRQSPHLARRLTSIPGILPGDAVHEVQADWDGACDILQAHAARRATELKRIARIHRDPFEAILVVLEDDSPLEVYRRIGDEILKQRPSPRRYPIAAAESARAWLMFRFALHLGMRQKNLRELLVRRKGAPPTPESELVRRKRGELRWSARDQGWEVLVPAIAFKNASSSYFGGKPYRLLLPNLDSLYEAIDVYLSRHRGVLLRNTPDPDTLFIKTTTRRSSSAAYTQTGFYNAWRWMIQRYGIYNPWTGRGAIEGLLPHGPHNVRDVIATHMLKHTGSYEQAGYAIQDTAASVASHYGRFLPQDKAALAAKVLNQVWEAADKRADLGTRATRSV